MNYNQNRHRTRLVICLLLAVIASANADAAEPPMVQAPTAATTVSPSTAVDVRSMPPDRGPAKRFDWLPWRAKKRSNPRSEIKTEPRYHYRELFDPLPLGTFVNAHVNTQVANGEAARMVLYRFDFVPGSERLNLKGMTRLTEIASKLPCTPYPVIIEPVSDAPLLSQARHEQIVMLLSQGEFPVPPERIVLSAPPGIGLRGPDSELIYRNLEILTGSGGRLRTRFDIFEPAQSAGAGGGAAAAGGAGGGG